MCVTELASMSLSWLGQSWRAEGVGGPTGTFFCDRTTAQFLPRTPIDMMLAAVIALKAYSETSQLSARCLSRLGGQMYLGVSRTVSTAAVHHIPTWYNLPCSEKMVMCRSYPALPVAHVSHRCAELVGSSSKTYPTSWRFGWVNSGRTGSGSRGWWDGSRCCLLGWRAGVEQATGSLSLSSSDPDDALAAVCLEGWTGSLGHCWWCCCLRLQWRCQWCSSSYRYPPIPVFRHDKADGQKF